MQDNSGGQSESVWKRRIKSSLWKESKLSPIITGEYLGVIDPGHVTFRWTTRTDVSNKTQTPPVFTDFYSCSSFYSYRCVQLRAASVLSESRRIRVRRKPRQWSTWKAALASTKTLIPVDEDYLQCSAAARGTLKSHSLFIYITFSSGLAAAYLMMLSLLFPRFILEIT